MNAKQILFILIIILSLSSCIVQAPKYSMVENVFQLKIGMSKEEVSAVMKTPPYDLKASDISGESIYIYKYRLRDRRTIPLFVNPTNGSKARGKYVDLFLSFGADNMLSKIESCSDCDKVKAERKIINFNAIITFVSITLPSIFLFLNLK